jgi:hypothetical protein
MPAKAGIQGHKHRLRLRFWILAFAGTTRRKLRVYAPRRVQRERD